jgi:hypothetical protein
VRREVKVRVNRSCCEIGISLSCVVMSVDGKRLLALSRASQGSFM